MGVNEEGFKTCSICGRMLPVTEYRQAHKKIKDKIYTYRYNFCVDCHRKKERERSKRRRESNAIRGYVRSAKYVVPKPEPPREFKVGERYEYKPSDRMHSQWDEPVSVTVIGVYDYEILTQTEHGIKYGFNRKSAELDLKQIN